MTENPSNEEMQNYIRQIYSYDAYIDMKVVSFLKTTIVSDNFFKFNFSDSMIHLIVVPYNVNLHLVICLLWKMNCIIKFMLFPFSILAKDV